MYNKATEIALRTSALSYYLSSYSSVRTDAQVLCTFVDEYYIIAFRGTTNIFDWITNLRTTKQIFPYIKEAPLSELYSLETIINMDFPYNKPESLPEVHRGFLVAYDSLRNFIFDQLKVLPENTKIIITGHSLGGALANICALDLSYNSSINMIVITFGAPKVGSFNFSELINRRVPKHYRYVNSFDLVPYLPFLSPGFVHSGIKIKGKKYNRGGIISNHDISYYCKLYLDSVF